MRFVLSLPAIVWICYVVKYEMRHFVDERQRNYLRNPKHCATAQAKTILVTGIPKDYISEDALMKLFSHFPGGIRKIWLNRCVFSLRPSLRPSCSPSAGFVLLTDV